jgi:hypothetical protein
MDVSRPTTHALVPARLRSWLPFGTTARGLLAGAVLASGIATVAVAQPPVTHRPAATLMPPQLLAPGDRPAIARGAIGDDPGFPLESTPVTRRGSKASPHSGPAWLSGIDPNVLPASGTQPAKTAQPVTNAAVTSARLAPPPPLKFPFKDSPKARPPAGPDRLSAADDPNSPDPNGPLHGTAANGAPVLAGPPAYRWYGYGSVTPGANPYAPSGQYPRASANWYSTTGATPGAFPVPVMNPYRAAPGSEPPTYATGLPPRTAVPAVPPERITVHEPPAHTQPPPSHAVARPPAGMMAPPSPQFQQPAPVGFPQPGMAPPGMTNPKSPGVPVSGGPVFAPAPLPAGAGLGAMSPPPVLPPIGVPKIAPPPVLPPLTVKPPPPLPLKPADSVAAIPLPPLPTPAASATKPDAKPPIAGLAPVSATQLTATKPPAKVSAKPLPLPASLPDDVQWQPTPEKSVPPLPGTWVPATNPRTPLVPTGEFGSTSPALKAMTARAQMPDQTRGPDPAVTLIQAVCRGRADGVDVRWTGSNRLAVCFEARSAPEATKLVNDISARPELGPLQIDFCVLVK